MIRGNRSSDLASERVCGADQCDSPPEIVLASGEAGLGFQTLDSSEPVTDDLDEGEALVEQGLCLLEIPLHLCELAHFTEGVGASHLVTRFPQ